MFKKEQLIKDVESKIASWNERSMFKLKGVGNLSKSDMETLELYAITGGIGLMKPRNEVAKVLEKYGYEHESF